MGMTWLVVLLIYGAVNTFAVIPPLAWWLLVPFFAQDWWDTDHA